MVADVSKCIAALDEGRSRERERRNKEDERQDQGGPVEARDPGRAGERVDDQAQKGEEEEKDGNQLEHIPEPAHVVELAGPGLELVGQALVAVEVTGWVERIGGGVLGAVDVVAVGHLADAVVGPSAEPVDVGGRDLRAVRLQPVELVHRVFCAEPCEDR